MEAAAAAPGGAAAGEEGEGVAPADIATDEMAPGFVKAVESNHKVFRWKDFDKTLGFPGEGPGPGAGCYGRANW